VKAKDAKPGDLLMIGEKWENICPVLSDNWRGSGNGEINVLRFVSLWLANRMFSGKQFQCQVYISGLNTVILKFHIIRRRSIIRS
tara:strand:- start:183 stop:437 length:255 start_codon:yes stop_codon:yes gene_type:complete